jgi:hypothetical protein
MPFITLYKIGKSQTTRQSTLFSDAYESLYVYWWTRKLLSLTLFIASMYISIRKGLPSLAQVASDKFDIGGDFVAEAIRWR